MIELANISKSYDSKPILEGINLSFPKSQITSIIGANGAGKSTLLSIAARLLKPDSGEVRYDGRLLGDYKSVELAKKISILKQQNHLNIRLKVRELVAFGRFPYCASRLTSRDNAIVSQAIAYMGLEGLEERFLDSLSGGQKQRAFIAMIIAQDTEYILLDEPLNNLDMKHCVQIMRILQNLVQDFGKSIILVLHDINFASAYSHNIVALKDGRLLKAAPCEEVIRKDFLKQVYDLDIEILNIGNTRICAYFQ